MYKHIKSQNYKKKITNEKNCTYKNQRVNQILAI